jgi:hypothetical protein
MTVLPIAKIPRNGEEDVYTSSPFLGILAMGKTVIGW